MLSATDFESLLPWYLNGTLTDQERALVAAYLKAHPEEDARVRWNASLRAGIKEQAAGLPEDLGLERALTRLRRESPKTAPSRNTGDGRHDRGFAAIWVNSLLRLRSAFARWKSGLRAVTLTSMAIVAVTALILVTNTTTRQPAPAIADSRTPLPPVADRQTSRPEEGPAAPLAKPEETSSSPQRGHPPLQKKTNDSRLAATSVPSAPKQEPPPNPAGGKQTEVAQMAAAPDGTTSLPAEKSRSAPPAEALAGPGPETGSQNAGETASLVQRPPIGASGSSAATSTPPARPKPQESLPPVRVAISGKADTSCPSADKQREDALRAANPDQPVRTPADWLEYIKDLLKAGCRNAADKEWVEFHKKYPNEKAPPELAAPR